MARILRVFNNVDMWYSHKGLAEIAKKQKVNVEKLEPGEFVMFVNAAKNRLKLYCANDIILYLNLPHGKIDMRTLPLIPQTFEATGKLDYDGAVKKVLIKELGQPQT